MVSAWPELPSAKPAELSAGACDGKEAFALCTSETPRNWRLTEHRCRSPFSLARFSLGSRALRWINERLGMNKIGEFYKQAEEPGQP